MRAATAWGHLQDAPVNHDDPIDLKAAAGLLLCFLAIFLFVFSGCRHDRPPEVRPVDDGVSAALVIGAVSAEVAASDAQPPVCVGLQAVAAALRGVHLGLQSQTFPPLDLDATSCGLITSEVVIPVEVDALLRGVPELLELLPIGSCRDELKAAAVRYVASVALAITEALAEGRPVLHVDGVTAAVCP